MKEVVDEAYRTGDTVGGVFEVVAHGVPPGLGRTSPGTRGWTAAWRRPSFRCRR